MGCMFVKRQAKPLVHPQNQAQRQPGEWISNLDPHQEVDMFPVVSHPTSFQSSFSSRSERASVLRLARTSQDSSRRGSQGRGRGDFVCETPQTTRLAKVLAQTSHSLLNCDRVLLYHRNNEGGFIRTEENPEGIDGLAHKLAVISHSGSSSVESGVTSVTFNVDTMPERVRDVWANGTTVYSLEENCQKATADSFLLMALRDENGEVMAVMEAMNKRSSEQTGRQIIPFDDLDESILTLICSSAQRQYMVKLAQKKAIASKETFQAILGVLAQLQWVRGEQQFKHSLNVLLRHIGELLQCERSSFYAVDHMTNELVGYHVRTDSKPDDVADETRSQIEGLISLAVSSGDVVNIPDVCRSRKYSAARDNIPGVPITSLLIAPLKTSNHRVMGVLQCANKYGGAVFDEGDEKELSTVCALVSDVLQRVWLDTVVTAFCGKEVPRDVKDVMFLFSHSSIAKSEGHTSYRKRSRQSVSALIDRLELMRSLKFDHWSSVDTKANCHLYVIAALEDTMLDSDFSMTTPAIEKFVTEVQKKYSPTNPFHNWSHAFATFHHLFVMLSSELLHDVLSAKDAVAVLVAALGHDAGHPGYNNAFLVNSHHDLAFTYNDISVLENYHASVTSRILSGCMGDAFWGRFREVVVAAILETDMAKHNEVVNWLEMTDLDLSKGEQLDQATALKFSTIALRCSDLGHPTLKWYFHLMNSVLGAAEFHRQFQEEQHLGLPTLPFMGKAPDDLRGLGPAQVGVIRFVVLPLWTPFERVVTGGKQSMWDMLTNLRRNQDVWQQITDAPEGSDQQYLRGLGLTDSDSDVDGEASRVQMLDKMAAMMCAIGQVHENAPPHRFCETEISKVLVNIHSGCCSCSVSE